MGFALARAILSRVGMMMATASVCSLQIARLAKNATLETVKSTSIGKAAPRHGAWLIMNATKLQALAARGSLAKGRRAHATAMSGAGIRSATSTKVMGGQK